MANFTARLAHAANYFQLGIQDISETSVSLTNTIVFHQSVDANNVIARLITNTIIFSQTIVPHVIYTRNVSNHLDINHLATAIVTVHNVSANNTLIFTQFAVRTFERSSINSLSFTQTISTLKVQPASNTLSLTQTLFVNVILNPSLHNTLPIQQFLSRIYVGGPTLVSSLSLSQHLSQQHIHIRNIHQVLQLRDHIDDPNVQHLAINQSVSVIKVSRRNASSQLILTQSVQANVVYSRSVSNEITFRTGYTRQSAIPGLRFNITTAEAVKVKSLVKLETDDSVILLPSPLLNDTDSFEGGKVDIKKSVVNDLYSYIRHTNKEKLKYTFSLDYNKAYELLQFLKHNFTKVMKMTNFKGEVWMIYINNSPFDFAYKMRAAKASKTTNSQESLGFGAPVGSSSWSDTPIAGENAKVSSGSVSVRDNERVEVTLEFVGEQL